MSNWITPFTLPKELIDPPMFRGGKPTIPARVLWGICLSSGKCQVIKFDINDEYAHIILRRLDSKWTFDFEKKLTLEDMTKKGLTRNNLYKKYPSNMLQWRCLSDLMKMGFSDVILGAPSHSTEEMLQDEAFLEELSEHPQQEFVNEIYDTNINLELDQSTLEKDQALILSFLSEVSLSDHEKTQLKRFMSYNWRTYQEAISLLNQNQHPIKFIKDLIEGSKTLEGTNKETLQRYLKTGSLVGDLQGRTVSFNEDSNNWK